MEDSSSTSKQPDIYTKRTPWACPRCTRRPRRTVQQYSRLHNATARQQYRHDCTSGGPRPAGSLAGAGFVAPLLVSNGYVGGSHWFVCPASPLAENGEFHVPSPDELLSASQQELASLRSTMGGSYGYNLGFVEDGRYHGTRNLRRPYFALMSDAPSASRSGYQTVNHDGRGQNVLF